MTDGQRRTDEQRTDGEQMTTLESEHFDRIFDKALGKLEADDSKHDGADDLMCSTANIMIRVEVAENVSTVVEGVNVSVTQDAFNDTGEGLSGRTTRQACHVPERSSGSQGNCAGKRWCSHGKG
ncbi:hypothetical protein BV898_04304 [Hypsibius exemplaris]|uniref:Uncharacterized protein n=1 Tax=Hypsibius exemplaris TaxID=2072580 RepID=A0A1W0X2K6_HYPEX|nr:hypothetical protein BV898_04304 [Hypsibius exemplaris]